MPNLRTQGSTGQRRTGASRKQHKSPSYQASLSAQGAAGRAAESPAKQLDELIIEAVDRVSELSGGGIVLVIGTTPPKMLREGPYRKWVWVVFETVTISSNNADIQFSTEAPKTPEEPSWWDRWGDSVLNCGSATGTGVAIWLSGGTATALVGAFALNSSALCGLSVGKAIEYDAWKQIEAEGGAEFKAYITVETVMSLADLLNGAKGAVTFLKEWKQAGKLAKLQKAISGNKRLTRKQLLKLIQSIEPEFTADLSAETKAARATRATLSKSAVELLKKEEFISVSNHHWRAFWNGLSDALTLAGTPSFIENVNKMRKLYGDPKLMIITYEPTTDPAPNK